VTDRPAGGRGRRRSGSGQGSAGAGPGAAGPTGDGAAALLEAIAARAEAARRLEAGASEAVLRSIVDATVTLFRAHAASIALYDPATNRLVFRVAAGEQGSGVLGLSITTDQGLAGYVFSTGQAIAISDVKSDARFGRAFAERTGYVPTSIVAVPLVDEESTIGVLQVLDKRDETSFSLRDVELASVFARQAAIAISASRVERDTATLLVEVARRATNGDGGSGAATGNGTEGSDALVAAAAAELARGDRSGLWALVDSVARLRRADPSQLALVSDLLGVLADHAERQARARRPGRALRGGAVGRTTTDE
jgi:GAF domain-containing protein